GMGLLLDIHYGDTWTSPGHQDKPVAWKNFNFQELTQAVAMVAIIQFNLGKTFQIQFALKFSANSVKA
ncbi:MAG TPA: hypothetical protein DCQ92_03020, partial [Verrucomicrobia subdivision 3 bacterium]|nr:hypothetical protein [Limisphaerales bacterium]